MNRNRDHFDTDARVSIRGAGAADQPALARLAQLEGHPGLQSSRLLVAELHGQVLAALPLEGGRGIADPFLPTAPLLQMLELRAEQLRSGPAPRRGLRTRVSGLRRRPRRPAIAPRRRPAPGC